MRNNLLTFSFTAVLAVLGIALQVEMNAVSSWICLLPYFLIIPFAARISYYRLASAHISSFLRAFAESRMKFELETRVVPEGHGIRFSLIAWLVNHEMVLLGMASSCDFYIKYVPHITAWTVSTYVGIAIPVILVLLVFVVADSTYNFKKMVSDYTVGWSKYFDSI